MFVNEQILWICTVVSLFKGSLNKHLSWLNFNQCLFTFAKTNVIYDYENDLVCFTLQKYWNYEYETRHALNKQTNEYKRSKSYEINTGKGSLQMKIGFNYCFVSTSLSWIGIHIYAHNKQDKNKKQTKTTLVLYRGMIFVRHALNREIHRGWKQIFIYHPSSTHGYKDENIIDWRHVCQLHNQCLLLDNNHPRHWLTVSSGEITKLSYN